MAYQAIGTGTNANDGSGDTLRDAGAKINDNIVELYTKFGDASELSSGISDKSIAIVIRSSSDICVSV